MFTKLSNRPSHYNSRYRNALTPREEDILVRMASGSTNGQIATDLGIGFETVKWHVSGILRKLDVESREEAAAAWNYDHSLRGRIDRGWNAFVGLLGTRAFAVSTGTAVVVVLALAAGVVLATLPRGGQPDPPESQPAVAVTPLPDLRIANVFSTPFLVWRDFAVADGAVWARGYNRDDANFLIRIDAETGATSKIDVGPLGGGVIAAGRSVWTAGDGSRLVEVDTASASIVRTIPLPVEGRFGRLAFLAMDEQSIWVSERDYDVVFRVSLGTGKVVAEQTVTRPVKPTLAFGSLWVPMLFSASVARLDPQTLEIEAIVPLGIPNYPDPSSLNCGACTHSVVQVGKVMWAFSDAPVTFSRIDPATNTVKQNAAVGAQYANVYSSGTFAVDPRGDIWFENMGGQNMVGEIMRFDTHSGVLAERIPLVDDADQALAGGPVSPWGLVMDGEDVWVNIVEGKMIRLTR